MGASCPKLNMVPKVSTQSFFLLPSDIPLSIRVRGDHAKFLSGAGLGEISHPFEIYYHPSVSPNQSPRYES